MLVANYRVKGRRPVHFGKNVYWTTTKGVIVTSDGKNWTLTGPGAEGADYGPYFGSTEQQFVVVTSKAFLKTEDGGKTWHKLADPFKIPTSSTTTPATATSAGTPNTTSYTPPALAHRSTNWT